MAVSLPKALAPVVLRKMDGLHALHRRRFAAALRLVALAIGVSGLLLTLLTWFWLAKVSAPRPQIMDQARSEFVQRLQLLSTQLAADLRQFPEAVGTVGQQRSPRSPDRTDAFERAVETRLAGMDAKLQLIAAVPLLKRDIQGLKDYQAQQTIQVDRIYDLSKWTLGIVVTEMVGLIGLAIATILEARKKPA